MRETSKTPTKARKGTKSQSNTPAKGKEKKPRSAAKATKPKPTPKQKTKPPSVKEESIEEVSHQLPGNMIVWRLGSMLHNYKGPTTHYV